MRCQSLAKKRVSVESDVSGVERDHRAPLTVESGYINVAAERLGKERHCQVCRPLALAVILRHI